MNLKNKKILFIDTVHPLIEKEFLEMGFQCNHFLEDAKEKLCLIAHEYFGFIIRSKIKIDKDILEKAKELKFIGRVGAGMENIDVDLAEEMGVKCFNSPEGSSDAVGEQTVGMLLSMLNNLNVADKQVRQGKWIREGNRGTEIKGKTFGIIGYGNMGSAVAQKLNGFGINAIAYDKYKFNYSNEFIKESTLDEVFEKSDIVSMHVPLSSETHYMVDNIFLNNFKKNIFFINTSRGKVVKTDDLVKNIQSGKVLGAALDVLEYEGVSFENLDNENLPEAFRFLINSDKVILSPHIAGWTVESKYKLAKVLVDKIRGAFEI
ncbi:MAG: hypothetical protein K8R41_10890 [Bacteroidales bacterium]|nr:hypothetical protein [Bacteroidales bacterium]